jgi:spoIIIJ-associated protein
MPDIKTSIEIIAPSVEEAITRGAAELGVEKERLDVDVLDDGKRGLFGIGTRQTRVRLTIRTPQTNAEAIEKAESQPAEEVISPAVPEAFPSEEETDAVRISREIVIELLQRMDIEAEVKSYWGDPVESGHIRPLHVDIQGENLGILIGRRAETMHSLQYITRLIAAKELHKPVAIIIDIEGYQARRERQLRQIARRIAEQVAERGRSISLEPMPANERRIIHLELHEHPDVYTESIGEGNRRKVTIFPQK